MKARSVTKDIILGAACLASLTTSVLAGQGYTWTNLESSIYGVTADYDENLLDPWGVAPGADGKSVWVANELSGTVTRYNLNGSPFDVNVATKSNPDERPMVVTIPTATGSGTGTPTGFVFDHLSFGTNAGSEFVLNGHPSNWLTVTLDGCVVGFNIAANSTDNPTATIGTKVSGAYFTGCALELTGGTGVAAHQLFVADFGNGVIDVFNSDFTKATLSGSAFVDQNPVAGFKPYNIHKYTTKDPTTKAVLRLLLVAYAEDSGTDHVPVQGAGEGYINVFKTDGTYVMRLVNQGTHVDGFNIDIPWGMAILRTNSKQADDLLVVACHGNDALLTYKLGGVFNVFNPSGQLPPAQNAPHSDLERADGMGPLRFSLIRGIHFGHAVESLATFAGDEDELGSDSTAPLYFTADIAFDERGLYGEIRPD